jgi:hypothetical protein
MKWLALTLSLSLLLLASTASAHYEPCTAINGNDSCPQAESCSRTDGSTGLCLPPPCNIDADCTLDPLRRCDKKQVPSVCIECYADSECATAAPRKTCELDPRSPLSNRCVECGLGRPDSCKSSEAGHRCVLSNGLCGCDSNADCPQGSFCRRTMCVARPPLSDGGNAIVDPSSDASAPTTSATTPPTRVVAAGGSGCAVGGRAASSLSALAYAAAALFALLRSRRARRASRYPSNTSTTPSR